MRRIISGFRVNAKGFTMIEAILAISVALSVLPLMTVHLQTVKEIQMESETLLRLVAFGQLRVHMAYYDVSEVEEDRSRMKKGTETYTMEIINGQLMIHPGTLVVLQDIEQLQFEEESGEVYATIEGKRYWIGKRSCLY